jgi:hypothetical protein
MLSAISFFSIVGHEMSTVEYSRTTDDWYKLWYFLQISFVANGVFPVLNLLLTTQQS